jgi:predicted transcriptional regulator
VNTILFRLYKKRLVTRVRNGRQYNYRLAIDQAKLVADRMRTQLSYASDPLNALNQFVKTLSADEEQALRKVLDRQGWQG